MPDSPPVSSLYSLTISEMEKQEFLSSDEKPVESNIMKNYWKYRNMMTSSHADVTSEQCEAALSISESFLKSTDYEPSNFMSHKPIIPKWPKDIKLRESMPDFIEGSKSSANLERIINIEELKRKKKNKPQSHVVSEEIFNWKNPFNDGLLGDNSNLIFSSNFECGNLKKAFKIGPFSYDLKIREDIHTSGHIQWYFFRVSNMISDIEYEFQISNLVKSKSLYEQGQRPLFYSEHLATVSMTGWERFGYDVTYTQNQDQNTRKSYMLKFKFKFPQTRDVVYISNCYPYSYSQLQKHLIKLKTNPVIADRFRHKILGKTPLGNNLDMICVSEKAYSPEELKTRKAIIMIGRVHPGETFSSHFINGFLEFCLGNSDQAQLLRKNFIIKIIPMLNPDGVIIGNHRCNYNGYDLNRAWKGKTHSACPEIVFAKNMIAETAKIREIAFFCDIHSHSRKFEAFLYGCSNIRESTLYLKERIFPYLLHREYPDVFSFKNSSFGVTVQKQGTARVVIRREFNVINSFTLEISFAGNFISNENQYFYHYNSDTIFKMGTSFASSVCSFVFEKYSAENILKDIIIDGDSNLEKEEYTDDSSSDDESLRCKMDKKKKKVVSSKNISCKTKKELVISAECDSRPSSPSSRSSSSSNSTSSLKSNSIFSFTAYKVNKPASYASNPSSKYPISIANERFFGSRNLHILTAKTHQINEDLKPILKIQNMSESIMQLKNSIPCSRTLSIGAPSGSRPQSANLHNGTIFISHPPSAKIQSRSSFIVHDKAIAITPTKTSTQDRVKSDKAVTIIPIVMMTDS